MARYSCTCTDPWRPPAPSPRRHSFSCSCSRGRRPRNRWTTRWIPKRGTGCSTGCSGSPLGGWQVVGMGQVFPVVTTGGPDNGDGGELRRTEWYLTQPALMTNLESPSRRLVLRTTLNFEGTTLGSGELTYGGWGRRLHRQAASAHAPSRGDAQLEPLGYRRRRAVAGFPRLLVGPDGAEMDIGSRIRHRVGGLLLPRARHQSHTMAKWKPPSC